ncbi:uncharacterized protein ARMOST_11454 [Armillaria ostoyae]|uniref:Uncharacterized protein n=1 Tax=Armillaria ostoyae TaxID=47428 RepID=A0A284RH73_ARMOS|nr:uncharacterized protein ARMOST_11454 [Armillaria ostoyae]
MLDIGPLLYSTLYSYSDQNLHWQVKENQPEFTPAPIHLVHHDFVATIQKRAVSILFVLAPLPVISDESFCTSWGIETDSDVQRAYPRSSPIDITVYAAIIIDETENCFGNTAEVVRLSHEHDSPHYKKANEERKLCHLEMITQPSRVVDDTQHILKSKRSTKLLPSIRSAITGLISSSPHILRSCLEVQVRHCFHQPLSVASLSPMTTLPSPL